MVLLKSHVSIVSFIIIYQVLQLVTQRTTATFRTSDRIITNNVPVPVVTTLLPKRQQPPRSTNPYYRRHTNMASTTSATSNQNGTTTSSMDGIAHLLARTNILELQPYRCARDDYSTGILLDANENSYGPPSSVREQIQQQQSLVELERYPDPYQIPLKERLIDFRGYNEKNTNSDTANIAPKHIFVGVGSDEAIDLLMRIFCIPQTDSILTTPPTYGMYKVCAKVNDVSIVTVPLTPQFDVEIDKVRSLSRVGFVQLRSRLINVSLILPCPLVSDILVYS